MTYELAKELKDAGFNQRGLGHVSWASPEDQESLYFPTLSELIEACGEEFHQLCHYQGAGMWKVKSNIMHGAKAPAESDFCTTPEEAVAMLYLALYGKKQSDKDGGETSRVEGR